MLEDRRAQDDGSPQANVNEGLTRDFVRCFVLRDLLPFRVADGKGFRDFLKRHLPGVGGAKVVRRLVDDICRQGLLSQPNNRMVVRCL